VRTRTSASISRSLCGALLLPHVCLLAYSQSISCLGMRQGCLPRRALCARSCYFTPLLKERARYRSFPASFLWSGLFDLREFEPAVGSSSHKWNCALITN